jgi:hypothetical protein
MSDGDEDFENDIAGVKDSEDEAEETPDEDEGKNKKRKVCNDVRGQNGTGTETSHSVLRLRRLLVLAVGPSGVLLLWMRTMTEHAWLTTLRLTSLLETIHVC